MENQPLYTFDFDGVICDSALETSITAWRACRQYLWPKMPEQIPNEIIDQFKIVRPALETGYEAILIVRLLFEGVDPHIMLNDFSSRMNGLIRRDQLDTDKLKKRFGHTRDIWIENDLNDWLSMNPLFPGFYSKLSQLDPEQCFIITTKQERFVHQILSANHITLPEQHIFGLERNLSKPQILKLLQDDHLDQQIIFIEDRLPTLIKVQEDTTLHNVDLRLADWGYNTDSDKQQALKKDIKHISLDQLEAL